MLSGIKWDTYNYDSYYRFLWQVLCNVNAFGMRIKMLAFCVHFPLWIPTNLSTWNLSLLYRIRLLDGVKSTAHKWNSLSLSLTRTHIRPHTCIQNMTLCMPSAVKPFSQMEKLKKIQFTFRRTHMPRERKNGNRSKHATFDQVSLPQQSSTIYDFLYFLCEFLFIYTFACTRTCLS